LNQKQIKELSPDPLQILVLVDFLPFAQDPEPRLRLKNIFIHHQVRHVARLHRLTYPVFVPFFSNFIKTPYKWCGLEQNFPHPREETDNGLVITTVRYPFLPRYYPRMKTRALFGWLARTQEKFDLIHCHTVYDLGLVGLELKEKLGLPLIVTVYGTDVNWLFEKESGARAGPRISAATCRVLTGADAVIGVSRDLGAKVQQLGVEAKKIHWVPNGLVKELFSPGDRREARQKLGLKDRVKLILYVGNILETKGLGDLAEALKLMENEKENLPEFRLLIAGPDQGYERKLRELIDERGLSERVIFLGQKTNAEIPELMRASDLFCLPSWREGWPCSVLEAMGCGVPVVATDVGGIPELVNDPALGYLCPARDPESLARSLSAAIKREWDPEIISTAANAYSYDKLALKLDIIYRQVLQNSGAAKTTGS